MQLPILAIAAVLAAAATPPAPTRWVEDHAGFLSPVARESLDNKLASYQRATGHQVIVWIDRTLDGAALDDWAVRTFQAWRIGRKGIDDGIAVFIFAEDRKIDIEVGYGLEDKVPDAIASRVIRETMAPRIRNGDRDGAVTAGVDAILAAIEGAPWQPSATAPAEEVTDDAPSWFTIVGGSVLALLALILFIKYPRLGMWLLWSVIASGRRGGFGGGGGGGGGFSGGGGRSGGGGARGGW